MNELQIAIQGLNEEKRILTMALVADENTIYVNGRLSEIDEEIRALLGTDRIKA